ncbi:MAG TPA: hypothetical protein DEV93_15310 [Chloroflexi bacterium]|nr:hypothetical protein [Chloroflexota bacterium]
MKTFVAANCNRVLHQGVVITRGKLAAGQWVARPKLQPLGRTTEEPPETTGIAAPLVRSVAQRLGWFCWSPGADRLEHERPTAGVAPLDQFPVELAAVGAAGTPALLQIVSERGEHW